MVVDNEPIEFDVAEVNAAVKAEIQTLGRYIEKAFKLCDYDYPDFTALSVTGGGLDIRGACGYLSDCIGRVVELLKPRLPLLDKPRLSSALGLMDMVLSSGSPYSGVAGKFRRLFGKRR